VPHLPYKGVVPSANEVRQSHVQGYGGETGVIPLSPDLPVSQDTMKVHCLNSVKSFEIIR